MKILRNKRARFHANDLKERENLGRKIVRGGQKLPWLVFSSGTASVTGAGAFPPHDKRRTKAAESFPAGIGSRLKRRNIFLN